VVDRVVDRVVVDVVADVVGRAVAVAAVVDGTIVLRDPSRSSRSVGVLALSKEVVASVSRPWLSLATRRVALAGDMARPPKYRWQWKRLSRIPIGT